MKKEIAEVFERTLNELGVDAVVRDDYSGRNMYGKTTYAVDAECPPSAAGIAFGITLTKMGYSTHEIKNMFFKSDNMGQGYIYY